MNPRLRRLYADYQQVTAEYEEHPRVKILSTEGDPAEKYVVEYSIVGLVPDGESGFRRGDHHRAELFLPLDYPRRPPFCRMLTPVFHPNIDPQKICVGDHWSAGQRLIDLIRRIGEMITFQSYNVKSPLNARAAKWAQENIDHLPLESVDLSGVAQEGPAQ
jgi:ubiquitin-protein ligase